MAVAGDGLEKFEDMIVRQAEATGAQVAAAKAAIGNVIFGQEAVVEQALITVLCGGHALLIGLPGLAKTKLVETMGIVLATQNPIEQEGTYPLPEAQLDRFLMQIDVDYPDHDAERKIVFDTTGTEESKPKPTMTADELLAAQRLVRRLPVGESVVEAILNLVRSARPGPESGEIGKLIAWGASPRASQALMLVARARALIDGRLSPSIDDVVAMAEPILKHRMALTFAARADGESMQGVIGRLKARIG
jgi:MoxR-like ATPase